MRVTQNNMFNMMSNQLSRNTQKLLNAQKTVATERSINDLSDNPVDAGRVLALGTESTHISQYLSNIDRLNSTATIQDSTIDELSSLLKNAKTKLLAESSEATSTSATRESARIEIAGIADQILQLANTKYDGQYIFSGSATTTPAFSSASVSVTPSAVTGGATVTAQSVTDVTAMLYHGYQIQFTSAGQYDVIDTTTGSTVANNQTYTSGGTIKIEGMEITLTNSPGAPAAGDTFTVAATAPGSYQGNSQVQHVAISSGASIQKNITGDTMFQGAGMSGGVDVFSILNQINTALSTGDQTQISALLDQLDQAQTQLSSVQTNIGARMNQLSMVEDNQTTIQDNLDTLKSDLVDIDVTEALLNLNNAQNVYDATLSAASQVIQTSLLDFLS